MVTLTQQVDFIREDLFRNDVTILINQCNRDDFRRVHQRLDVELIIVTLVGCTYHNLDNLVVGYRDESFLKHLFIAV